MHKKRSKMFAVLTTMVMLAMMLLPMATPAFASATYGVSSVRAVANGTTDLTGSPIYLQITLDSTTAATAAGSSVVLDLPSSPSGYKMVMGNVLGSGAFANGDATVTKNVYADNEWTLTVGTPSGANGNNTTSTLSIPITSLTIPGGVNGDVTVYASAKNGSVFSDGSVTIATAGSGTVAMSLESVANISASNTQGLGIIDVKESNAGALTGNDLHITLPPGFTWDKLATIVPVWGDIAFDSPQYEIVNNGRELKIDVKTGSTEASWFRIKGYINVDQSVAKVGTVTATIDGVDNISTLDIANYGDYGLTATTFGDTPALVAGQAGQDLGKFQIKENLPNSLLDGRTITLSLPSGLKWAQYPQLDSTNSTKSGVSDVKWQTIGSDAQMIQGTVSTSNESDLATLVFKKAEVTPALDYTGDVTVAITGSEGLTGDLTLGTVTAPVTMDVANAPDSKIGVAGQSVGNVTITENNAGAISSTITYSGINDADSFTADANKGLAINNASSNQASLQLVLPAGVTFTSTPALEVTSGDLQLDVSGATTSTNSTGAGVFTIPIKSESTTPSTISLSNIQLTIDRTVPVGPIALKVKGTAVNQTTLQSDNKVGTTAAYAIFQNNTTAAKTTVATVVTPAPGQTSATVVFTVGNTNFTINGVSQTMDVAPYVQNGRTFLPMRYAAQALGVSADNILFSNGKVTLIKGSTIVQLTLGSDVMTINGTPITMDVKASTTNDRTMLPLRWLGKALGATLNWDQTTQTITMSI